MNLTLERGRGDHRDPDRLRDDVEALGVDETSFLHATGKHPTWCATGITDLTPGRPARLLDIAEGRSGTVLAEWLAAREPDWRARILTASLDPFRGYATALAT
ncbi:MAG: transposase, partial [Pseudonocardiaceae bacterium]